MTLINKKIILAILLISLTGGFVFINPVQAQQQNIGQNIGQQINQFGKSFMMNMANAGVGAMQKGLGQLTKDMPPIVKQLLDIVIQPIAQQIQQSIQQGIATMFSPAQVDYLSAIGAAQNGIVSATAISNLSVNKISNLNGIAGTVVVPEDTIGHAVSFMNDPTTLGSISKSIQHEPTTWIEMTDNLAAQDARFADSATEMNNLYQRMQEEPIEELPEDQPIDTNIISQAAEAAKEKAEMVAAGFGSGGQAVIGSVYVKEVGDQLRKIKEILKEVNRDRVANELSKKYLKKIEKYEADEDKNRREKEAAAEAARNAIAAALEQEKKDILEKEIKPNLPTNMLEYYTDSSDIYRKYLEKLLRENQDELLALVPEEMRETYKRIWEESDQISDITKMLQPSVEKCYKNEDIFDGNDPQSWVKWNSAVSLDCTVLPTLKAYAVLRNIAQYVPDKIAQLEITGDTVKPEFDPDKPDVPTYKRVKEEPIDAINKVTHADFAAQEAARAALAAEVSPEKMPENITQKLAEEAQNWLDQIIQQGLSMLQDLLSGLLDGGGDSGDGDGGDTSGGGGGDIPPSEDTIQYDIAQAQNDLANAQSLLSAQKLVKENISGQYLTQQQNTLNLYTSIQAQQHQILDIAKNIYLGSTSTSTPTTLGGVTCALPTWILSSKTGENIKLTADGAGEITFNKQGEAKNISYNASTLIKDTNEDMAGTQERITALNLAISSTENLITLLTRAIESREPLPTINEILGAKETAIKLGARAINAEKATTLIGLDSNTQGFIMILVETDIQIAFQRESFVELSTQISLNYAYLQTIYKACPK